MLCWCEGITEAVLIFKMFLQETASICSENVGN
jgi:hypothetical protein